ncbi:MAG: hypothetical protein D6767_02740 [Candidatus Hydrogenedentota bacterium]|nr:MAG: hypothetical protein D6767_02740 [Candidatus Hydrogenedentota bacterium]
MPKKLLSNQHKWQHEFIDVGKNIQLEILSFQNSDAQKFFFFLPCMMGNVRAYRLSTTFLKDFSAVLINPRGHGQSTGQYIPEKVLEEVLKIIAIKNKENLPIIGSGHSGGGAVALMAAQRTKMEKVILFSPILDSVKSLKYMYDINSIHEFWQMLDNPEKKHSILKSPEWLSPNTWQKYHLKEKLSYAINRKNYRIPHVGQFLENCFIPGFQVHNEFLSTKPLDIFLPKEDLWFPMEITENLASQHPFAQVYHVAEAKDHFFKGNWSAIWKQVFCSTILT